MNWYGDDGDDLIYGPIYAKSDVLLHGGSGDDKMYAPWSGGGTYS